MVGRDLEAGTLDLSFSLGIPVEYEEILKLEL